MIHTNSQQLTGQLTYTPPNTYTVNTPEPVEPGPIRRAEELIGYLQSIDVTLAQISDKLFGPVPVQEGANSTNAKDARMSIPLDELLARACTMSAGLCGYVSTICNKL